MLIKYRFRIFDNNNNYCYYLKNKNICHYYWEMQYKSKRIIMCHIKILTSIVLLLVAQRLINNNC